MIGACPNIPVLIFQDAVNRIIGQSVIVRIFGDGRRCGCREQPVKTITGTYPDTGRISFSQINHVIVSQGQTGVYLIHLPETFGRDIELINSAPSRA